MCTGSTLPTLRHYNIQKIERDPKRDFDKKLLALVEDAISKGIVDSKLRELLIVKNPVTPILYLLPKIHSLS